MIPAADCYEWMTSLAVRGTPGYGGGITSLKQNVIGIK